MRACVQNSLKLPCASAAWESSVAFPFWNARPAPQETLIQPYAWAGRKVHRGYCSVRSKIQIVGISWRDSQMKPAGRSNSAWMRFRVLESGVK